MGKIWLPGGGVGADLDVVTAGKPDVLVGKVIVDKDGEPLTGTMPDRGAISTSLGINGTYTIPEGYHNGSGKVTQNIATMGGQTITPGNSQQTISTNGKYMTGNITISAVNKYGVISRTIGSSSSTKYFSGDFSGTLHYIELNPGFTPTCITAILAGDGQDSSVYTSYGQFIVSSRYSPAGWSVRSTLTSNSLIIPVCTVGTYNLLVTGYY